MVAQLRSIGRPVASGGPRNIKTTCPSPSHNDNSPSTSIRRDGKAAKCWSCTWKGSWNKIAALLNLDPLPGTTGVDKDEIAALAAELKAMQMNSHEAQKSTQLPAMVEPWSEGSYRGFSAEILKKLGTLMWHDFRPGGTAVERILWPFYMNGELTGGSGRVLDSSEPQRWEAEELPDFKKRLKAFYKWHPKYRNLANTKAMRTLYGFDLFDTMPTVILAEGPTSTIKLLDAGLPALGILGAANWSTLKAAFLISKGVKNVIICFDGDPAGRMAAQAVQDDMEQAADLFRIDLPEGSDPDDCSPAWFDFIVREVTKLL